MSSKARWWDRFDPADIRERVTEVNDGIIAVAGMGLGLAGADVAASTAYAVIVISALAGALSVFGVKLGEAFADFEAQQYLAEQERRLLELTPDEEIAELTDWFVAKGVSSETARQVADELSAADALSAQLELEHGIRELASRGAAWQDAVRSGVGFLVGSLAPVVAAYLTPLEWRPDRIIIAAALSLTITSIVLSRLGLSRIWATIARSLAIGLGALVVSYLLGDWLV